MNEEDLSLGEFIQLIQREVQKSSEYLARGEVREVTGEAPSEVFFTMEKITLQIPVNLYIRKTDEEFIKNVEKMEEPQKLLERGYIKVSLAKKEEEEAKKFQYNLMVKCQLETKEEPTGRVEISLLPVSKR